MNKCWKCQANIYIGFGFIAIQLKYFGNRRPTLPFSAKRRPTIAKIFQLNSNKSETNKDIGLKFSAFVHHMSGLNWQKNFGHNSINSPVAPSSIQKLWAPLATKFVEKKKLKKILVSFLAYLSYPMEGIFDILKKMAFWNILNKSSIQSQSSIFKLIHTTQ